MKTRFEGRIIRVEQGAVELPNGARGEFEVVRHPGGSAVVAVDRHDRVCLLRQYRYAVDDWLWELPAGKLDNAEAPIEAARRELAEEAGLDAGRWLELGVVLASPGILDERIHLFMASDLVLHSGAARAEAEEVFEVQWRTMDEAQRMARDGRICDAKTVIGLYRAASARAASHAGS